MRDYFVAKLPSLAERLEGADPLWGKAMAVVCPTGGYLHSETGPAVYRVGDRLANIPPFTGDGDCDRARFGRARGRAYPGRPLAGRLP
jgi:hypothetical protein